MTQLEDDQSVSRRSFLKAAAVTAAAATATGAGAALLKTTPQAAPSLPQAATFTTTQSLVTTGGEATAELFARLAAVQADNMRLQAELDAAQRRLEAEEAGSGEAEILRAELAETTQQASLLTGLLALYEQLEDVDLGDVVDEGLASVSTSLSNLLDELPSLSEGIEAGRQALDDLDEQIPLLEDGRQWLEEKSSRLQLYFDVIESLLTAAVDASGPFLQMLDEWFQGILKWLPFGLGQRALEVMRAMADLLTETPDTISGIDESVVRPMDVWLKREAGEVPLRQNLVKPLREKVLTKGDLTVTRAHQLRATYEHTLAEPAQATAKTQQAIRQLIAEYRQQHQI